MSRRLERLITDLGERSSYDAASQCSRCGYCEQACPTYVATGRESKSGRGRNQVVRLLLEGRLRDPEAAEEALSTCLLCGACTTACYAHVPTADLVLEGRRLLRGRPHWLVKALTRLLVANPERLASLLKLANAFKRAGLSRLGRPFLRLAGLGGLAEADEHVEEAPSEFLFEKLRGLPRPERPRWLYFAPCGPNYLYPRVGLATVKGLEALHGPGRFMENSCCGLLCYNYGEIEDAKVLAKRCVERLEALDASAGSGEPADVVVDCSSCAAFMKSYPQLFVDDPAWRTRAERFSSRIKDAVEAFDAPSLERPASGVVVYHESCRARHGQGLKAPAKLLGAAGASWRELPEADVCCGGGGAFTFLHPELSDEVLRRKIGAIASVGARRVLASSTSCLIQLARGLKKYYPDCTVEHVSEFFAGQSPNHGTKTGA